VRPGSGRHPKRGEVNSTARRIIQNPANGNRVIDAEARASRLFLLALRQSVRAGRLDLEVRHQLRVALRQPEFSGWKVMKKSAWVAALFFASTIVSSLADDSDKQTKMDEQAKEASEEGAKKAKEASENAQKEAKEAGEKAEKEAKEASEKAEKKAEGPWDIAFGTALLSEYNIRGISASDHRPAVSAYFEPHYDFSRSLQAYAHVETNSITFPAYQSPAVELYGGVRPTFDRLMLDFGFWEHWLVAGRCFNFHAPGGLCIPQLTVPYVNSLPADISFWEVYGKATYNVDRRLSFGGQVYWTPSVLNSGAEATYVRGWTRYVLPPIFPKDFGWFISAEAGHWFRDTSPYPSYTNWKIGLAFTWKQFTLDLRYSDTDRQDCAVPVAALDHTSNRCGASFIARLAVDLTKAELKPPPAIPVRGY
jgi:hypothetical protein